ncbi:Mycothiol acetyltransferase [Bacillus rhizoplanae]|uniref:Mycothiol acetyltransferase n=1 Tax=Bacillus rhizoplanae TaxID=2880966 RepID=A0ABM8YEZ9_9BACI|nr:GNAT family N-acetyltransferase [Bacillus rhizoplanae]CAG9614262.1 Mycothiol acetyltransferase [Bacillus rhizoplanae]
MKIKKKNILTSEDIQQIIDLATYCERNDGLEYKPSLYVDVLQTRNEDQVNDFLYYQDDKLVGFVSMYEFERPTKLELIGMVHPSFRRQKICSNLLDAAFDEIKKRNINELLFIVNAASTSGNAFAKSFGLQISFSEYSMQFKRDSTSLIEMKDTLQLVPASTENLTTISKIASEAFGDSLQDNITWLHKTISSTNRYLYIALFNREAVGTITVSHEEEVTSISGFAVDPSYQGRGIGKNVLQTTVQRLLQEGKRNITLEVETENENALQLYKQCGFEITTSYHYYDLINK